MSEELIWGAEAALSFAALWFVIVSLGWMAGKMIDYIKYRRKEQKKSRRPYCNTDSDKSKGNN